MTPGYISLQVSFRIIGKLTFCKTTDGFPFCFFEPQPVATTFEPAKSRVLKCQGKQAVKDRKFQFNIYVGITYVLINVLPKPNSGGLWCSHRSKHPEQTGSIAMETPPIQHLRRPQSFQLDYHPMYSNGCIRFQPLTALHVFRITGQITCFYKFWFINRNVLKNDLRKTVFVFHSYSLDETRYVCR